MAHRLTWMAALCCTMAPAFAGSAQGADIAAGRGVAQQNCGGCHAVGRGASPLADAPPFRMLYLRYPPEGLGRLLQEGMLAPLDPRDDAPKVFHPRMPLINLDTGQVDDLRAYLQSLEPAALMAK